ncbi:MAG TPA: branched-chain amino acid ABC transporter permease [Anaerolineae bacterium]|nr:branched-chain amino acid ABC transporter permease [Anaerolineae bacterium]
MLQRTLETLPKVLLDGVTFGFVYASIALGYTMVYGVLEFINFAHSEIFMVGGVVGIQLLALLESQGDVANLTGLMPYLVISLAIMAGMIVAGGLAVSVERVAYRPLRGAPRLVPLISAIGVSFFLQDAVRFILSITTGQFDVIIPSIRALETPIVFSAPGTNVPIQIQVKSIVVIVVAIVMLVGLNYLVNATKVGRAIRAVAQDRSAASLMGVNVNSIIVITFLIGGALGGAAGMLFALKATRINAFTGFLPGLRAFTAAVLGGIGSLTGALLGGLVLGILESFAGSYLSMFTNGAFGGEYKDIITFAILIIILIFRPSGLLGQTVAQKA